MPMSTAIKAKYKYITQTNRQKTDYYFVAKRFENDETKG